MSADDKVLSTLVANHDRFLSFLERRLKSRDVAEEVLQAAFVKSVEKSADLKRHESAVAWFYRLLRNAVSDQGRRRGAEERRLARRARALPQVGEDEPLKRVVCKCVNELVPLLKPEYSTILKRAEIDGASLDEIAREAGISANNAAVRLHRARKALRKKLEVACGTCTEHGCLDCSCREA